MTDTFNNTIQSPPPKRRKLSVTMSASSSSLKPSLQPSALDRTRSLRKPTSTAKLMKATTTTGAVGMSAGSSTTTRGAGIGAPKQRPVSMIQAPSTTKGALPVPGTLSRTAAPNSMGTAIGGSGIKGMSSVTGTKGGANNSNIKPPASGGLNRLASTILEREGGKIENTDVEAGSGFGTGISSGPGHRVGSGAATTSTIATKSTTSTTSSLRQPLRARAPPVSATSMTAKATPLSPPTTTLRSVSGPFGMTRPTTSSSSASLATITSPRATATSDSGTRIGTGIGLGGRGHARTQSATISSPKPTTPKPALRNPAVSRTPTMAPSKSAMSKENGISKIGAAGEPRKSASKGVPPPSTPGKSRPQSVISTNALRRSPATATPKTATTTNIGGTPKVSTGTGFRLSPAHKRQISASLISTTGTATTIGTKTRTAANPGTATSTATTQTQRLAASRKPMSLQAPKPVTGISKPASTITATTTTVTKPALRQPKTASSSTIAAKPAVPKPITHIPEPHSKSTTSRDQVRAPGQQQHPQPRHDFDTYQQHYTPAKIPLAPKPLTSSYLAPPTPSKQPANIAASAEMSRMQTELLQLHLLHRDAERVKEEWEGDAKRKLRERWARVRREQDLVGEMEAREVEEGVVEGLLSLGMDRDGDGRGEGPGQGKLDEQKIQALDEVISGVWAMSEPSSSSSSSLAGVTMGKYTRVVRRFEVWAERAGRILEERRRRSAAEDGDGGLKLDENGEVEMIGTLDVEWKNECIALGRRLEEWQRMLDALRGVSSSSKPPGYGSFRASRSIRGMKNVEKEMNEGEEKEEEAEEKDKSPLDRILSGFGTLMDNMLADLEVMEQIEREAVAEETEWVKRVNRVDDEEDGEQGEETVEKNRAGAIWRAF